MAQVESTLVVHGKIRKHYDSPCNCYLNKPYPTNLAPPILKLTWASLP